jgi:cytochrome P450
MITRATRRRDSHSGEADKLIEKLLTPEGICHPYGLYRALRQISPMHWSDRLNAWIVVGYSQTHALYRDFERFSSQDVDPNMSALPHQIQEQLPLIKLSETSAVLNMADPPAHTLHRAQVSKPLTPRRLYESRSSVEELCERLLQCLDGQTTTDLIQGFSLPYAYELILGLFGASSEHIPLLQDVTKTGSRYRSVGGSDIEAALAYEHALGRFKVAIEQMYADARLQDPPSVITSLVEKVDSGDITTNEVFAILKVFFAAGHENLIFSIATAVWALINNPEQLALVRSDPNLYSGAYEEAIRWDTPHQANVRIARLDTHEAGHEIRRGDRLLLVKGSANRDEAVWSNPDAFSVLRDHSEPVDGSVAFGQGVHFCLGAGLVRLAGPLALQRIFDRYPNLSLADGWEPAWLSIPFKRMLSTVDVTTR